MATREQQQDLRDRGANDFDAGKAIIAYYDIQFPRYGYKRHQEAARANYERGYRDRRDEMIQDRVSRMSRTEKMVSIKETASWPRLQQILSEKRAS